MAKKAPRFEALVVNAIRRLQAAQGSTANEIANYLSQEYEVSGPDLKKQIQLTIRRGVNYGILQKSKRGYITCDRNIPTTLDPLDSCFECKHRSTSSRGRSRKRRSAGRSHGKGRKSRGRSQKRKSKKGRRRAMGITRRSRAATRRAASRRVPVKATRRRTTGNVVPEKSKTRKKPEADPNANAQTPSRQRSISKSPTRNNNNENHET